MKHLYKTIISLCMAIIMACVIVPVAAEETPQDDSTAISVITDDDGSRAYELVWRYKTQGGHLYKRRWNLTINAWYDPAWILVN